MSPIEVRLSSETNPGERVDRAPQELTEEKRELILVVVYCCGILVFVIVALYLCRKPRHCLQTLACNAGATRRERLIEEGPKTPTRRRLNEEIRERWEVNNRKRLKKTLDALELEQYREAHSIWLRRVEEREMRAHMHQWDLKKKERHLLHEIHKLRGRPRMALEERHREQRLEDKEASLEQRHQRLEVLQREINESLGMQLQIRARRSEESVPHTRAHSRENMYGRSDHENMKVPGSIRGQSNLRMKDDRKVRGISKKSFDLLQPDRNKKSVTPIASDDRKSHRISRKSTELHQSDQNKKPVTPRPSAVPNSAENEEIGEMRQDDTRRVSLVYIPHYPEPKSHSFDQGATLKSSLKPPQKPVQVETGEESVAQDTDSIHRGKDLDSKPRAPPAKSEDQSKPDARKRSEYKPTDPSKKIVEDQSKPDRERKSESKPPDSSKKNDDKNPRPSTSPKIPIQNTKKEELPDSTRKSEIKPPDPDKEDHTKSGDPTKRDPA